MIEKNSGSGCLKVSLDAVPSSIRKTDGTEIPFARAVLSLRNECASDVVDIVLHVSLGQEGGTVQDLSGLCSGQTCSVLNPGNAIFWDVYDVLIPAHPGSGSKVHMFGYRAVLNWTFTITAFVEYRIQGVPEMMITPRSKWSMQWRAADPALGGVLLTLEDVNN